jgi:hypothetical protein
VANYSADWPQHTVVEWQGSDSASLAEACTLATNAHSQSSQTRKIVQTLQLQRTFLADTALTGKEAKEYFDSPEKLSEKLDQVR